MIMFENLNNYIDAHLVELLFSLVLAVGLNVSVNGEPIAKTIIRVITGFRYKFLKSTLATFTCAAFVSLYGVRGVFASVVFLLALRLMWLVNYSYWIFDHPECS